MTSFDLGGPKLENEKGLHSSKEYAYKVLSSLVVPKSTNNCNRQMVRQTIFFYSLGLWRLATARLELALIFVFFFVLPPLPLGSVVRVGRQKEKSMLILYWPLQVFINQLNTSFFQMGESVSRENRFL
jgi:hypothetical protein